MKDENGKVTIEGYYDGIEITPDVKKILESTPHNEEELLDLFQVAGFDKVKNVRQGKFIELDINEDDPLQAHKQATDMCEKLLANTVIENYQVDLD